MKSGPMLCDYREALLRLAIAETPAGSGGRWGPRRVFEWQRSLVDEETVRAILAARGYL